MVSGACTTAEWSTYSANAEQLLPPRLKGTNPEQVQWIANVQTEKCVLQQLPFPAVAQQGRGEGCTKLASCASQQGRIPVHATHPCSSLLVPVCIPVHVTYPWNHTGKGRGYTAVPACKGSLARSTSLCSSEPTATARSCCSSFNLICMPLLLKQEIINQFGGDVPVPLATWQLQALEKLGIDQTSPAPAANELSGPLSDDPSSAATESRLFSPEMMYLKAHGMPPVDPRLLAGLRVMLLAEDERYMLQLTSPDTWGRWGAPLSKLNEVSVRGEQARV
eukprot:498828-Pelagomonas_calceolata.AAC.4